MRSGAMWRGIWMHVRAILQPVVQWLALREPAGLPRWVWALGVVLVAYVGGRLSGQWLSGVVRLALLAAALVVGWQLLHVPA